MAIADLLVQYGLAVLFAWAVVVHAGVPAPAIPMLVGAGALSGSGKMHLCWPSPRRWPRASVPTCWYSLGRFQGARALAALGRFSMDRDHLVRRAKNRFTAHRGRYLVLAKFLPGLSPLATGLAGVVPLRPTHFLLNAATGPLL
jgi:membrane protein DedA with SNARE-associated domain